MADSTVKKYSAKTAKEALQLVKQDLGDEAYILLQRTNKQSNVVEILASKHSCSIESKVDLGQTLVVDNSFKKDSRSGVSSIKSRAQNFDRESDLDSNVKVTHEVVDLDKFSALTEEVKTLRKMLQEEMSEILYKERKDSDPLKRSLKNFLLELGFSKSVSEHLSSNIDSNASFLEAKAKLFVRISDELLFDRTKFFQNKQVLMLVGPTGAGKSCILSKLAALYSMHRKNNSILLISLEQDKIAYKEHTKTVAKILNTEMLIISSSRDYIDNLDYIKSFDFTIIDTPGLDISNHNFLLDVHEIGLKNFTNFNTHLVLPAYCQIQFFESVYNLFRKTNKLILTKLDQTDIYGPILSFALSNNLQVGLVSSGHSIPNDIEVLLPHELVERISK